MPISVCEYCGKPFNTFGASLCPDCSKLIEESYVKARKYIYQNSQASDFTSIVSATEIPEKALSYLINKGRIIVANRGGARCRACGKETKGGALCDSCSAKIMAENLLKKKEEKQNKAADTGKKSVLPITYHNEGEK
jgi:NMD protein affecting ribosome stability and mRNA decay